MKWKLPPRIKIYEALGTLADKRMSVKGNKATVISSGGQKTYQVIYDPETKAITANDNGSYWQGYLGYPTLAMLMKKGVIQYDKKIAQLLQGIAWQETNTKFKNDFNETEKYVLSQLTKPQARQVLKEVGSIYEQIQGLKIAKIPSSQKPPK